MGRALELAQQAQDTGEVPVGAVLVKDGMLVAEGWNQPIGGHDPSAHAEMQALRVAGQMLRNYRLPGTTLYVTLEPCVMCMGAIVHARVRRLVYGAADPLRGCAGSVLQLADAPFLNHRLEVSGGLYAKECADLLKGFFKSRR